MRLKIRYIITLAIALSACETLYIEPNPEKYPQKIFDEMWQEINDNYAYLSYKRVDWEAVKRSYRPLLNKSTTEDSLLKVLGASLQKLRDGHVKLNTGFDRARYWNWYLDHPLNYNQPFVQKYYLGNNFKQTGPFRYQLLNEGIAYVHYPSFNNNFSPREMARVLDEISAAKGLILDIRGNTGGNAENITGLMSYFVDQDTEVGKIYYKAGRGANDFTAPQPVIVRANQILTYKKPVAVLTNRQCYSACNIFASMMGQLSRVIIIGDRTGGGGGFPVGTVLSNGWQLDYPVSRITLPDGTELEDGIVPDIQQYTGPENELKGKDAIIERAQEWLIDQDSEIG